VSRGRESLFWNEEEGLIKDRRLRADVLFIRAQSVIRADGFSSAQHRNAAARGGAI
jgi:hypothetical protein